MFVNYKSEGLILKKEDRGEADRIFSMYTKDFGLVKLLGRGIRKIFSKLRPNTEIFYLSKIGFIQGKRHKTLTDSILLEKFKNLTGNLDRLKAASQISEAIIDFLKGQEGDKKIWFLLLQTFRKLNNIPEDKIQILYYCFIFNFFGLLGYKLQLHNCSACGGKVFPSEIFLKISRGGIICKNCSKKISGAKQASQEAVKIMRIFLKKNWEVIFKINIKKDQLKILEMISKSYISYVSGIAK